VWSWGKHFACLSSGSVVRTGSILCFDSLFVGSNIWQGYLTLCMDSQSIVCGESIGNNIIKPIQMLIYEHTADSKNV
jgi:hypothetical protein